MKELWGHALAAAMAIAVIASAMTMAAGSAKSELEEDHALSMEFETPHTDWAKPYALGKVRVLYFGYGSYGRGIEARDLIELMERFDVEAAAAYYHRIIDSPQFQWDGGEAGIGRILRLLDEHWDCFVFNGLEVTLLPTEAQYKMYKAVSDGAGLILIGVDDDRALKPEHKIKPADLPAFLAHDPVGDAFHAKKGRAIRLPARPQIAFRPGWEVDYDYWLERVGRAVLWAGGKEPRLKLRMAAEATRIPRTNPREGTIKAEFEMPFRTDGIRVEKRLRRDDGAVFQMVGSPEQLPGTPGPPVVINGSLTFRDISGETGTLRAGQYHVDIIMRGKDGVEAWATVPVEVTASRTVTDVRLDKDWGEVGDGIAGTVALAGDPLPGEMVRMQLLDARQRILVQADQAVADSKAAFAFPIEDWMPMLLEVRAVMMAGSEEVSSTYTYFRVTKRNRGQFNFVVWDYPPDSVAPYAEQQLARLGCTVQLYGGSPSIVAAASNTAQIPYTTRIMTAWDKKGSMKPVCWNDEPAVDQWVDSIVQPYEKSREHGVFVYSLGDETATTGCCVHPACLAAYRRYLRQEYGDIAALNASWGTSCASWDEVNLLIPDDNDEAEALRQKIYSRWYDRQAFKGYNFVKLCERFGKHFRQLDPQARTGFEGAGGFADGTDIDLICRTNGFWSPYPGPADEVLRSIAPRGFIHANWMGYTKDAESLLGQYWRMVTRGDDSVWWWMWTGFGTFRGLLAPDLAPWPAIKEMQRDTQIVRDGLGSLLLRCKREDDGIAILWSYPSEFANKIEAGPSYGTYEDDHVAWQRAVRALGLQFSYVTDRMLRQGEFRARRYKVLILPQTEAVGPKEAAVIRDFVERGGTVIADVRPGVYDGHCKPLAQGALDDVFGFRRSGNAEAVTARAEITGALGSKPVAISWANAKVDAAAQPTTGKSVGHAGAAPLCIVNQIGRGRAALLNFTLDSFPRLGDAPANVADFFAALMAFAGVEPQVVVTDAKGKPVRDTEVIRWKGRGVDFLTLFGGDEELVQVRLPGARHVYDLRDYAYRGETQVFKARKLPRRATFIALSDEKLAPPHLERNRTHANRGEKLKLRFSYPGSGAWHAARVRVHDPSGAHAEWLDQVALVGPKGAEVILPIAYNDPTGEWTIQAVDLFTDESAVTEVTVK